MKNQKHSDLPVWAFDSRAWGATSPDRKIGRRLLNRADRKPKAPVADVLRIDTSRTEVQVASIRL